MRKSELKTKIRELTWTNLVQTCAISDHANQLIRLKAEIEGLKATNTKLQVEHDAEMYKLSDIINSLIIERDSFKEEAENYNRWYFEQRHAKEQAEAKIKALEQALNFNEMVQRLSVISELSFDFCKTLDDVAEEAKRERAKVKANDLIDEMCKQLSGEIEELLKVKGLYHVVRVSIHKSY